MAFTKPVIIVGAPRSGTSLMQQIIREHPAFVSVARESSIIWEPFCHPMHHDWHAEGVPLEGITREQVEAIRADFERYALSSSVWRKWAQSGIMKNPAAATVIKTLYKPAYRLLALGNQMVPSRRGKGRRLVDKSVHYGLWLDLVEAVFPDALYIHITRDGYETVDSMIGGWLQTTRFQTYAVPLELNIEGYDGESWCFPLPAGWQDYIDAPVEEVVAFQWGALQRGILDFSSNRKERFLQVKLEDLTGRTEDTLRKIAEHIEVPWSSYFEALAADLPVVNAAPQQPGSKGYRHPERVAKAAPLIEPVMLRLGYETRPKGQTRNNDAGSHP